jgi:hypothetical protein
VLNAPQHGNGIINLVAEVAAGNPNTSHAALIVVDLRLVDGQPCRMSADPGLQCCAVVCPDFDANAC